MRILPLVLAACAALQGACATRETAPASVPRAVAEAPCDPGKRPQQTGFPADQLTGDEDIWILGTVLWADRKARKAYEALLEPFADECSKR